MWLSGSPDSTSIHHVTTAVATACAVRAKEGFVTQAVDHVLVHAGLPGSGKQPAQRWEPTKTQPPRRGQGPSHISIPEEPTPEAKFLTYLESTKYVPHLSPIVDFVDSTDLLKVGGNVDLSFLHWIGSREMFMGKFMVSG